MRDNHLGSTSHLRRARPSALAAIAGLGLLVARCGASQEAATSEPASTPAPAAAAPAESAPAPAESTPAPTGQVTSFHQLSARTIEGKAQPFTAYDGRVVRAGHLARPASGRAEYEGGEGG